MNITVMQDKIAQECREAIEIPSAQARFKRYRLNLTVSLEAKWLSMAAWDGCPQDIDLASLKGRTCYAGLDLASVNDTTALSLIFPEDDGIVVLPFFWLPEDNLDALSLALERFAAKFFGQGCNVGGVLTLPNLRAEGMRSFATKFREQYSELGQTR